MSPTVLGCQLTWNGIAWVVVADNCSPGGVCTVPARDGAFIGEVVVVPCLTTEEPPAEGARDRRHARPGR